MNSIVETPSKLAILEDARTLARARIANPEETIKILVDAGVINNKPWWKSLGISGSLTALSGSLAVLIVSIAKYMGYEIDIGSTELLLGAIVGLISALTTWLGRVHAVQPISMVDVIPKSKS